MQRHPLVEHRGLFRGADKQEALPVANVVRPQRKLGPVDIAVIEVRRGDQPAVERVRPGVVGAHQRALPAVAVLIAQARAAMAADVGKRMELAVEIARQQHTFACEIDDGAIAALQPVGAGCEHPAAVEDALALQCVDLVRDVVGGGERAGVVRQVVRHDRCPSLFPTGQGSRSGFEA